MKKLLVSLLVLLCVSIVPVEKASAQGPVQLAWLLKSYGSAQIVQESNHYWAELYDGYGNYQGRGVDYWMPWYCQIQWIGSGDNQGTPIRIQWAAPYGSAQGCIPNAYSQFYGWTDGLGTYEGQNFWHGGYVIEYESYVFPRGGNNSRGTTTEIY
jgi:hypothetical protein